MAVVAGDEKKKTVGRVKSPKLSHIIRIKTLVIKSTKQLDEKKNKSGDKTVKEPDEKVERCYMTKNLVTVKGTIHMKALAEVMKKKLNKNVEIFPAKNEGSGEKKEKNEVARKKNEKNDRRWREEKQKKKGDGGDKGGDGGGKVVEGNIMMESVQYRYSYAYGPGYMAESLRMFSAENPNACVVM